jgi:hypothetical protein
MFDGLALVARDISCRAIRAAAKSLPNALIGCCRPTACPSVNHFSALTKESEELSRCGTAARCSEMEAIGLQPETTIANQSRQQKKVYRRMAFC